MDVFNSSTRRHRNKSIIQLQESQTILKSNLLINNQLLQKHDDIINALEENVDNLKRSLFSLKTYEEKDLERLNNKIVTMENYIKSSFGSDESEKSENSKGVI